MKYELGFLEEFVQRELKKSKRSTSNKQIPDYTKKQNQIQDEFDRIKKTFRDQLFAMQCEKQFELFIQHHQTHIISLADKVSASIDKESTSHLPVSGEQTNLNLFRNICFGFEELLTYIETYFSRYFNQDHKIPISYYRISLLEITDRFTQIAKVLDSSKVNQELIKITMSPTLKLQAANNDESITFRDLIYLKQLTKDLAYTANNCLDDKPEEEIYNLLFYFNFNTYDFIQYATTKIKSELQELPSLTDQLEKLSYLQKVTNQAQVKPSFAYNPKQPSIQEQLGSWIAEEIHFIEKKRQLTLMIPPGKYLDMPGDFKVSTALSVPQLAYSIRLLKDAGIITNQNQSDLIKFFAKHFSSAKNENISSESLRIKYYNTESSAIKHIQQLLNKMIQHQN